MHLKNKLYKTIKPLFQQLDSEILPTLTSRIHSGELHEGLTYLDKTLFLLNQDGYASNWRYKNLYHSISSLRQFFIATSSIRKNELRENKSFLIESRNIITIRMKAIEDILKAD